MNEQSVTTMPATQHSPANLDDLIQAHSARLRVLQRQQARMGNDTPPHIVTEIADIEAKLVQIQATIQAAAASPVDPEIADALGPVGRYQLITAQFLRVDGDISDLKKEVRSLHEKFDQLLIGLALKQVDT